MAEVCKTPDLGRILAAGLFLLDDCMRPIFGPNAGYIDNCVAAVSTTDNEDVADDFTRRCADGSIKINIPGKRSLQSIEVAVDFNWLDPEWIAQAGGAQPVMQNGEVIGWGDATQDRFNVAVVVWQEILGGDCTDDGNGAGAYVRIYPLKGARLTEEGDMGSAESYQRVIGLTVDSHDLGAGPWPLAMGTDGEAAWLTDCLPSGTHRIRFMGAPVPDECGAVDTEEPDTDCTAGSGGSGGSGSSDE